MTTPAPCPMPILPRIPRNALYLLILLCLYGFSAGAAQAATDATKAAHRQTKPEANLVHVYSYRQPFLVQPLFDAFTQKTGIQVKVIFAQKGLIERAAIEGKHSPVDVILTTDISRLIQAAEQIAQPVDSPVLQAAIPAAFRAGDNKWFGLTKRARVVFASRARVAQQGIDYEDLADPAWRGKLCMRNGQHVYNLALIAAMIAHHGEDEARRWLRGLKANLARKPAGNDRAQVRAIYAGECDIALGNTYYMGKMETNDKQPEQKAWAKSVRLIFPNDRGRGTHVNLSGMVMAKYAPHPTAALALMEYLVSRPAQAIYAEVNYEYPVRENVPVSARVAAWGQLRADQLKLDDIAALRRAASRLVDEVGFND